MGEILLTHALLLLSGGCLGWVSQELQLMAEFPKLRRMLSGPIGSPPMHEMVASLVRPTPPTFALGCRFCEKKWLGCRRVRRSGRSGWSCRGTGIKCGPSPECSDSLGLL